jgi:small GTP-binding protein
LFDSFVPFDSIFDAFCVALQSLKIVVLGDGNIGKTSLLETYASNSFSGDHLPTIFDSYSVNVLHNQKYLNLLLWDTSGQDDYDQIRPLAYPGADLFLICYATDSNTSYCNVKQKWIDELRRHCPDTPVMLVATKSDLRVATEQRAQVKLTKVEKTLIDSQAGAKLAKQIGAVDFKECSALTQVGVIEVFEAAVEVALQSQTAKKKAAANNMKKSIASEMCCFM